MKYVITLLLFFTCVDTAIAQTTSVRVLDRSTGEAIIQAHIKTGEETVLATTDLEGYFSLNMNEIPSIVITAIGYESKEVLLQPGLRTIYLNPAVIEYETGLLVIANPDGRNNVQGYSQRNLTQNMDQLLDGIDGLSTNKRGAFAWEPVVRGQSDQRMNLMIDGMQVFKACVDKMDPITSYVETNNLSTLEIDKSGSGVAEGGNGSSSINLITQRAKPSSTSFDINTAYRQPDNYRLISFVGNTSDRSGRHAMRFSGNYKKADDFIAGNGNEIDNTQFEKLNLNVSYRHRLNSGHTIEANYIMDKAYDIGYPALLMDATRAFADIGQIRFNAAPGSGSFRVESVQLYANAIRHTMDDYSRDVANRSVMRGMHMPMYGETFTVGSRLNGSAELSDYMFEWFLDGYFSRAYGDMEMNSLDPSIEDMFIYNLRDVNTERVNVGFKHQLPLSSNLLLKLEQSLSLKSLSTGNDRYASFFEGLYNRELGNRSKFLLSASGNLLWMPFDKWSFSGNLVYSERMGNHMELFGHYIYNYADGYFYDGNPWLKTERALNFDLNTTWETDAHSISFTLFHKQFFNYIDGLPAEDSGSTDFLFKQYANVGDATISGVEMRTLNRFNNFLSLENRLSYLYAQNQTLNEPLPLIPPLKGNSTLHLHFGANKIMGEVDWASVQSRIAETASIEDETDAFAILNLTLERSWMDGTITSLVRFNNLFDREYHTHTSIGNIPEAGRSVMISLGYSFR